MITMFLTIKTNKTNKTKKSSGKNKILILTVLFSLLFTLGAENFFTSQDGVVSTNSPKVFPRASDFWVNTSIIIDANAASNTTQSGNWIWAANQDWCSGLGTVDQPYLIENMTFDANVDSNGLSINNSVGIFFTIQNCTFTNALSSGYAGLQLDNTDNGTIVDCNASNNNFGINLKSNCNWNTIVYNDVSQSSTNGINFNQTSNYNNVSYNTVTDTAPSTWFGGGIYLGYGSNYNIITFNNCSENGIGIYLYSACNYNIVENNNCFDNSANGILIRGSGYNAIQFNSIIDNNYGIVFHTAPGGSHYNECLIAALLLPIRPILSLGS